MVRCLCDALWSGTATYNQWLYFSWLFRQRRPCSAACNPGRGQHGPLTVGRGGGKSFPVASRGPHPQKALDKQSMLTLISELPALPSSSRGLQQAAVRSGQVNIALQPPQG